MRPGCRVVAGCALLGLTLGLAAPAQAQTCRVTLPIGPGGDLGTSVAIQTDGKIVMAGYSSTGADDQFVVVRYNPNFTRDLSFDLDGVVTTNLGPGQDRAEAMLIQPDGKILVAGHRNNGVGNNDFALVRYNPDGSLDTTFNPGGGFGGPPGLAGIVTTAITGGDDEIEGVALQADGKIVVAGWTQRATRDFVVARYNTDGSLDIAGFNTPFGYFISTNGAANDEAHAVAIQSADQKIVIAGYTNSGANDDFAATRFTTAGAIDGSFGGGTVLVNFPFNRRDRAYSLVIQPDGSIVLAGEVRDATNWNVFGVARLTSLGILDTATFNPLQGTATTNFFAGVNDTPYGLALQPDGKIVLGGWANWPGFGNTVDFALARFDGTGALDTATFNPTSLLGCAPNQAGKVTTNVRDFSCTTPANDWIDAIALQTDGKIVAAGYSSSGADNDLALVRYNGDGSIDTSCAVPTYHRSIGLAADYGTAEAVAQGGGTRVAATTGSAVVTGTGTAWQTANRGRGDRITIDGTDYTILWVDSETSLRLTSVFNGLSGSGKAYTIARKFTGVDGDAAADAWEDCIDGPGGAGCEGVSSPSLIADERREAGIFYADGLYTRSAVDGVLLRIRDAITDAQHTITVTADGPNRHYGVAGSGVQFQLFAGSSSGDVIEVHDRWVTVEWIEITGDQSGSDGIEVSDVTPLAGKVTLRHNLIHDVGAGIQVQDALADVDVYNSSVYAVTKQGIAIDQPLAGARILNNTIYNATREGIFADPSGAVGCAPTCTYPTVLLRNNLVHTTTNPNYSVPGLNASSSHNLSEDGSAATPLGHSPAGGGRPNVPLTGAPGVNFVSTTPTSEDLHLQSTSDAIDNGADLSPVFIADIDAGIRPSGAAWDIGADEFGATTVVELLSFVAAGADSAVGLSWRTGSELDNLGFHLYRSLSSSGPWTRITPALIPGLGSSPEGASYSFRDIGLTNGVRYYYRLEDIDAHSGSTFHGPVSAVPGAASPSEEEDTEDSTDSDPPEGTEDEEISSADSSTTDASSKTYGRPEAASFRVVSRTKRAMVVELRTPGFTATETPSGVKVSVPGFDQRTDPRAPDLPLKRVVLDAVVGRHARIVWVKERRTRSFPGLRPAAVGSAEIVSSPDGTVRPRRRSAGLKADGLLPRFAARIPGDAFIGETKKLALEMSPLRYDASTDELRLARRLRVKIAFDRKAASSETGFGSRGRRRPRSLRRGSSPVLAHLHTQTRGLYGVSFETLFPQGHEALPLESLRLSRQGDPVPFHVEPKTKDFGPGSVLYFHASQEAASTDFSPEVAYALERATGGVQMPLVSAPLRRLPILGSAPLAQERFETNRYYQAGLLDAPDIWLWDFAVGGMSTSFPLSIEGLDPTSALPAHLQIVFQGASEAETEGEHHLSVSLNGTPLGETSFDGKLPHVFSTSVPASVLLEGESSLTVTNLGDTGAYSFVFLDRVALAYPQTPALRAGRFSGVFSEEGRAIVSGEAQVGLDVTDPESPVWLQGLRHKAGTVRFKAEAGHRYVLASSEGLLAPRVSQPLRSTLRSTRNQTDYVVIAPAAFLEAAQPLLERRQDQGLTAKAVSFEEIASEFGHGRPSARAIRDFLAYAYHSWTEPSVRYVLLLGDASYDPRNFTGFDQGAPLPALWAKTSYLWTSSDPALGAVNGEDLLPDVAIGRLPARTLEEAHALVEKVLAWEDSAQDLSGTAVLVADNPDKAGDFEADVLDVKASFLGGRETKTLFLRQLGGNTRPEILASFDEGASLMSYVGHGGAAVWASENVLNSWDTAGLRVQSRQPLMLTFNCLNGYFVAPNYDSLSEAFLKVEGRGTIGAFSPSGLSLDAPAHRFHRALMAEITSGEHKRLGDAVLAAQAAYAETGIMPELLAIYHLLADPGMKVR